MPRLARFSADHPHVTVNVMTTAQGAPRLTPTLDLAIRYGAGLWNDGEVAKLFDERVVPVCSPDFLARQSEPLQLERTPLIHVNVEEYELDWLVDLSETRRSARKRRPRPPPVHQLCQATQAALDGQGIMLGWESITGQLVRDGRLVEAAPQVLIPRDAFYLVSSPRIAARDAAQLLARWLARGRDGGQELPPSVLPDISPIKGVDRNAQRPSVPSTGNCGALKVRAQSARAPSQSPP